MGRPQLPGFSTHFARIEAATVVATTTGPDGLPYRPLGRPDTDTAAEQLEAAARQALADQPGLTVAGLQRRLGYRYAVAADLWATITGRPDPTAPTKADAARLGWRTPADHGLAR